MCAAPEQIKPSAKRYPEDSMLRGLQGPPANQQAECVKDTASAWCKHIPSEHVPLQMAMCAF